MKRFLSLLLLLVLLVSVSVGCSKNDTSGNKKGIVTNTEIKEANFEMITFMHWRSEDKIQYQKILDGFKKTYRYINVDMEISPSATYATTLQTRLMSGAGSDIFAINGLVIWGKEFNKNGLIMDLSKLPLTKTVIPSLLDLGTDPDGKVFGVYYTSNFAGVIYNKSIFNKLNLQIPTTWSEFLTLCEKIKTAKITPLATGFKDGYTANWVFSSIEQNLVRTKDPQFYDKINRGTIKYSDSAELRSAFEKFKMLSDKGYYTEGALGTSYVQAQMLFTTEKAAMFVTGNYDVATLRSQNQSLDMGVFPMPSNDQKSDKIYCLSAPGLSFAINEKSSASKKDAAVKFLEYLYQPQVAKEYSEVTTQMCALTNVTLSLSEPVMKDFDAIGKNSFPNLTGMVDANLTVLAPGLQNIVMKKNDAINDILAAMDKVAGDYIAAQKN